MQRVRGLGFKILLLMAAGVLILAVILTVQMTFSLFRVRDQALQNAASGLEEQSRSQLLLLHEQIAARIQERLYAISDTNLTVARAILASDSTGLIGDEYLARTPLSELPGGALADLRPGRITSVYVPPNRPAEAVLADLRSSAILDTLLPQQLLSKRQGVLSAVYVGPSGLVRAYPAVDVRSNDFAFEQALVAQFSARSNTREWLPPFRPPPFINTVDDRITAAVIPIYAAQTFRGILISYVSLGSLTADLIGIQPTSDSWVFVIGDDRQLIATSERFLPFLNAQNAPRGETFVISRTVSPDLDRAIEQMAAGAQGVDEVSLDGRRYTLTYRPIAETNWSLGLAVPIDELTRSAATVSEVIRETSESTLISSLLSTAIFVGVALLVGIWLTRRLTKPLGELAAAAHALGAGDYDLQVPVRSQDEIGEVALAFNAMSRSIRAGREELRAANRQLEETVHARTATLEETVSQLQSALALQGELDRQLREASTPIIPVAPGVLLMPLIGSLDRQRAEQAIGLLLQWVETAGAREVILDITGLPTVDGEVAAALVDAAAAVRLMGARTILTGIRPEVAEILVSLGGDLGLIEPMANLQAAITLAFRRTAQR